VAALSLCCIAVRRVRRSVGADGVGVEADDGGWDGVCEVVGLWGIVVAFVVNVAEDGIAESGDGVGRLEV
jgi:hypothetical protein